MLTQQIDNYLSDFIKNECYPVLLKEQQKELGDQYKSMFDQIKEYMLGLKKDKAIYNIIQKGLNNTFSSEYQAIYKKCESLFEQRTVFYNKQKIYFYQTYIWPLQKNPNYKFNLKEDKIQWFKNTFGNEYDLTTPEGRTKIKDRLEQEWKKWKQKLATLRKQYSKGELTQEFLQELYKKYTKYDKSLLEQREKTAPVIKPETVPFSERRKRGRPPKAKNEEFTNNTSSESNDTSNAAFLTSTPIPFSQRRKRGRPKVKKENNNANTIDWDNISDDIFASKHNRILQRIVYSLYIPKLLIKYAISNNEIERYINHMIQLPEYKKLEQLCINHYHNSSTGKPNTLVYNIIRPLNEKNLRSWLNLFLQNKTIKDKFKEGLQKIINEYFNNNTKVIALLPNINTLSTLTKDLITNMINIAVDKGSRNTILQESCNDYIKPIVLQAFKEIIPSFITEALQVQQEYIYKTNEDLFNI